MRQITCPHCQSESLDQEFCDACGRSIVITEVQKAKGTWTEKNLTCLTVITDSNLAEFYKAIPFQFVEKPFITQAEGVDFRNYYPADKVSLDTYLKAQEYYSFEMVNQINISIFRIFNEIQEQGYVVGGVNLADFWLEDGHLDSLVYRPLTPLLTVGSKTENPEMHDFYSQEYINKRALTLSSDVFIVGSIFTALMQGKTNAFVAVGELHYVAHQLLLQRSDFPINLYSWVNRSTNVYEEERFSSIAEQQENYLACLTPAVRQEVKSTAVCAMSDLGNKKRQMEGEESELNQDRYYFVGNDYCTFALVADGISTAKIGSGSIAAEIVKEAAADLWERDHEMLMSEEVIIDFLHQFVTVANERIVDKSSELAEGLLDVRSSHLMGTTLVAAITTKSNVYSLSIGDSRAYRWSTRGGLQLLHSDQNVRNELLTNHVEWEEVKSTEEQASLTYYLGMADTVQYPFTAKKIPVDIRILPIESQDLIFLCSDGLTDYLNPIGYQNDIWKSHLILQDILAAHRTEKDWTICLQELINLANSNGGGDNITVLLMAFDNESKAVSPENMEEE